MRHPYSDEIPFSHAILWILLSTLLISGSAFTGWLYFLHIREKRLQDEQYRIVAIVQKTSQRESLKSAYLAEWLDLSSDRPSNLHPFNVKEATQKLLQQPVIQSASVGKIFPGALLIHYEMRIPSAHIGDIANASVDRMGTLFPFRPFFQPRHLPVFYLGLDPSACQWGECLGEHAALKLAFSVLETCAPLECGRLRVKQIDTSHAEAESAGERQIILVLEEERLEGGGAHPERLIYLRLNPECYAQGLANFCLLHRGGVAKPDEVQGTPGGACSALMIDLRIPHLAFFAFF